MPLYICPLDTDRSIYREVPPLHHEEIIVKREKVAMILTSLREQEGKEQCHGVINARETTCWKRGCPAVPPCPEEGERNHAAGVLCYHRLQPSVCRLPAPEVCQDALSQEVRMPCLVHDPGSRSPAVPSGFTKSSGITDFVAFPAFRYVCALTIVSLFRSCIVSSIPTTPFSPEGPATVCNRADESMPCGCAADQENRTLHILFHGIVEIGR